MNTVFIDPHRSVAPSLILRIAHRRASGGWIGSQDQKGTTRCLSLGERASVCWHLFFRGRFFFPSWNACVTPNTPSALCLCDKETRFPKPGRAIAKGRHVKASDGVLAVLLLSSPSSASPSSLRCFLDPFFLFVLHVSPFYSVLALAFFPSLSPSPLVWLK